MIGEREELYRILDFILNHSDRDEIKVLQEAIRRRLVDLSQGTARLNITGLARSAGRAVEKQLISGDKIQDISRDFIRKLILQQKPEIPEEHIDLILDEYLPSPEKEEEGKEGQFPHDVVKSMIVQFVDYSLGRMSPAEKKELVPDWSRKYWKVFNGQTRRLISDLLEERISEKIFWERIEKSES